MNEELFSNQRLILEGLYFVKEIVHWKMEILPSFIRPYVVLDMHE